MTFDQAAYDRNRRATLKLRCQEFVSNKDQTSICCISCSGIENLEFSHNDSSTKVFNIADAITHNLPFEEIESELLKVSLRCKKCHTCFDGKVNHPVDIEGLPAHGTPSRWVHYNCNCILCKEAHAEYEWARLQDPVKKKNRSVYEKNRLQDPVKRAAHNKAVREYRERQKTSKIGGDR